jgi:hypothetical protein
MLATVVHSEGHIYRKRLMLATVVHSEGHIYRKRLMLGTVEHIEIQEEMLKATSTGKD